MVVVKVEIWPHGDESKAREIGRMNIALQDVDSNNIGTYYGELKHAGRFIGKPGAWKSARGFRHFRESSPYHLIASCLSACGIRGMR